MRKLPIAAAAAMLVGTSAYAMIPSTEPTGVWTQKDPHMVQGTTAVGTANDFGAALQPASADWWTTAEPVADTADDTDAAAEKDAGATADVAESDPAAEPAVAEVEPASFETTAVDEAPAPVEAAVESGVGGPYEGVDPIAADLTPRPAAANYPACRPGPGDDRCIQLYEPGVRQQLASWSQPTGGFAGSADTQVAMGGPYEPVDAAAVDEVAHLHEAAMHGDGSIDTALGETAGDEDEIAA